MAPYCQHLLYRERPYVNLSMGHVDYRWTSRWRCLLWRNHSICQKTPLYRTYR